MQLHLGGIRLTVSIARAENTHWTYIFFSFYHITDQKVVYFLARAENTHWTYKFFSFYHITDRKGSLLLGNKLINDRVQQDSSNSNGASNQLDGR
jgi:hypothetical protein